MKSMNTKCQLEIENQEAKLLAVCFVAVLMLFGVNCIPEFATDTYSTFCGTVWPWMLYGNGRVINAGVYYVFEEILVCPMEIVYILSYISAIICLTLAVFLLGRLVNRYCENVLCSAFISIAIVANLFSIEYFLFIEKGLFAVGILLVILACRHTAKYLECGGIKNIVIAEIFLVCVVYIYQGFLGLFVVVNLPLIIKFSQTFKQFVKNNIIVAGMYGSGMVIGLVTTKYILKSVRFADDVNYRETVKGTLFLIKDVFLYFGGLIPKGGFALAVILAVIINCVCIYQTRKYFRIFEVLYILAGVTIVAYIPYFMGTSTKFAARILYPYAALFGILLFNVFINYGDAARELLGKYRCSALIGMAIIFLIQCYVFNDVFIDRYKCNQTDKYLCAMIQNRIEQYESENDIEVTTICIYNDAEITGAHDGLDSSGLNTRASVTAWSDVNSINYYSGRSYQRGEAEPEYQQYFSQFDWNVFCDEQMIFEGDTLHLCIY